MQVLLNPRKLVSTKMNESTIQLKTAIKLNKRKFIEFITASLIVYDKQKYG